MKASYIQTHNYMRNTSDVDIVINDKRSFSKAKKVW